MTERDEPQPVGSLILYQTEDGRTRVECRFEDESLWLTQAQMALLFETTPQNVTLHLKAIFAEGELVEDATCKEYLQVRSEGARQVAPFLCHHRLPAFSESGSEAASMWELEAPASAAPARAYAMTTDAASS